jgi:peroxidase
MVGGPFYTVRLGRKDSLTSTAASTIGHIPMANQTISDIIGVFEKNGFTVQELVALTGAHTIGFSHCKEYADRLYNYKDGGAKAFDPSMDPRYAKGLQAACAKWKTDPTIATFNDIMTPGKFDNLYFKNLERGLGLLATDEALFQDRRTKPFVQLYASNQTAFFHDFAHAMEKLSVFGVKTGRKGEVRRRCDAFNHLST